MKEEIKKYKNFIQDIKTINEAIKQGFPVASISRILNIKTSDLLPILDYLNNPTPRFPYKPSRQKIQKFADSYRQLQKEES
jgi:hypothetical protein